MANEPVVLPGAPAFRDLGGIAAANGRRVRPRMLFRSEALLGLGEVARARIRALQLKLVCDLRGDQERSAHPCLDWLDPPPHFMRFDLASQLGPAAAVSLERMRSGGGADAALQMMLETYAALPLAAGQALRTLFRALCAGEVPLLVHCTAGKDRTGFVSAMLLAALRVPLPRIYEDYLHVGLEGCGAHAARTAQIMGLLLDKPLDAPSLAVLSGCRQEFLAESFAAMDRDWGGVQQYLVDAAGMDAACRQTLAERFLIE